MTFAKTRLRGIPIGVESPIPIRERASVPTDILKSRFVQVTKMAMPREELALKLWVNTTAPCRQTNTYDSVYVVRNIHMTDHELIVARKLARKRIIEARSALQTLYGSDIIQFRTAVQLAPDINSSGD